MKRTTIALLLLSATATSVSANTLASWKETPPVGVGVTGMIVTVTSSVDDPKAAKADTPHVVTVTEILSETPADGRILVGDVLESVNGVSATEVFLAEVAAPTTSYTDDGQTAVDTARIPLRRGSTGVWVTLPATHDLDVAARIADRIAIPREIRKDYSFSYGTKPIGHPKPGDIPLT